MRASSRCAGEWRDGGGQALHPVQVGAAHGDVDVQAVRHTDM
jgi:hypothetical protein